MDNNTNGTPKRLYKSDTDVMIGGGLAEYFNIDPSIVRIMFGTLVLTAGTGIMLYVLLWIILPNKSEINNE